MSREEIREGVATLYHEAVGTIIDTYQRGEWEEAYSFASLVLDYLRSQGVVIKVERELPVDCNYICCFVRREDGVVVEVDEKNHVEKCVFVAVEPLIEEE